MEKQLITIVVSTKNAESFLPRMAKSLKGQEGPFEVLVTDCMSTDGTLKIAEEMGARISSEYDNSPCRAWCRGIPMAQGSIISLIGADDYLMPDTFKVVRETFNSNFNSWVVGRCVVFQNGELQDVSGDMPIGTTTMIKENLIPCPSCFFTKNLYESVGGADPELIGVTDYDLWMRFLHNGNIPKQIPDILSIVNLHGNNYSYIHAEEINKEVEFIKNKYKI